VLVTPASTIIIRCLVIPEFVGKPVNILLQREVYAADFMYTSAQQLPTSATEQAANSSNNTVLKRAPLC
jgi:hypothetical protein